MSERTTDEQSRALVTDPPVTLDEAKKWWSWFSPELRLAMAKAAPRVVRKVPGHTWQKGTVSFCASGERALAWLHPPDPGKKLWRVSVVGLRDQRARTAEEGLAKVRLAIEDMGHVLDTEEPTK